MSRLVFVAVTLVALCRCVCVAGEPATEREEVTNSVGIRLVLLPPGEYVMGNSHTAEEEAAAFRRYNIDIAPGRLSDECPAHRVRITRPFYMGIFHVTRGQFRQFVDATGYQTDAERRGRPEPGAAVEQMPPTPGGTWRDTCSFAQADTHPVVFVSWNDAIAFCKWLSAKEEKTYRLPTEAEWEYACRAGTTTRFHSGDDPETLASVANVRDAAFTSRFPNVGSAIAASDGFVFTAPVGQFKPNRFGLFDMHGNAWQWCSDWYGARYYSTSPVCDPLGPSAGTRRVLRGGSWGDLPIMARSSGRLRGRPIDAGNEEGFRVARDYR